MWPQDAQSKRPRALRTRTSCFITIWGWLAMTSLAFAQSGAPAVAWNAPADCPSPSAANVALRAMVGDRLASGSPGAPLAKVAISHAGGQYAASIGFGGGSHGARELRSERCDSLAEAALLVIAITAVPVGVTRVVPMARSEPSEAPPTLAPELGVHISGDLGSLPEPTLAPGIQLGLRFGALRLGIEGALWVPKRLERASGSGGLLSLSEADLRACFDVVRGSSLRLGPCGAFAIGLSAGSGRGLEQSVKRTQALWSATRLGISLRQDRAPLFVELVLDLGLTIVRPDYTIDGTSVFHPLWFGRTALAVGWVL